MKGSVVSRLCLLLGAVVLVIGVLMFGMLARYDRKSKADLELFPVEVIGEYSEEGGEWKPLTREVFFQNLTYRDITVRGHFSRDLPPNSKLFLNIDQLYLTLKVNGKEIFEISPKEGDGNPTQALGRQWVTITSPGISTEDVVELNFGNLYINAYIIQFDELLWQMYTGDVQLLLLETIRIDAWPLGMGVAMLILSLFLLTISVGFAGMRIQGAGRFLWMGLIMLSGACFFLTVSSALTLVLPYPLCYAALYVVGMQGLVVFIVLFVAEHLSQWRKTSLLWVAAVALAATGAAFINQILSAQDLYLAVDLLSILALIAVLWLVYCTTYEARKMKTKDAKVLLLALIPVALMSALEIYNGFFQFGHTAVMLGIGLLGMILVEAIYALYRIHQTVENEKRALVLENELQQSHIQIMLSQIQPHFLYNSLTGIKELCDTGNQQTTSKALEHFAFYMRSNMDSLSDKGLIPFALEVGHVRDYLYLEKMRFEEKLTIVWELSITEFMLPSLTLQTIVENAVRHGITEKKGGGTLTMRSEDTGDTITVTVIDDGVGFDIGKSKDDGRSHIGISNVRKRLAAQCGGTLHIESKRGLGTTVKIILPKTEVLQYENLSGRR